MALDISGGDSLYWKAGIDTSDFTKALKTVEDALNQSTKNGAQAQEQIFKALKQGADGVDHSMHNMAGSIEEAMGAIPKATNQALLSTKQIAQQLEGVTTNWQQLNTAFHGIFHGKSGEESLGYAWSNGLKEGKVSLSQFVESLKLTDKQLAGLPEKLEKAGYVAKGTFTAAATETNKLADSAGHLAHVVSDSITTMQSKIQGLQGQTIELKAKGVDTAQLETSLTKLQGMVDHLQHEELTLQAGKVDTSGMVAALDKVQSEFDSLSKETLNLKVGAIDTASVQKALGDLKKDISGLQGAAIELQVKGINTDSLTASLKKVETQANALHDITLSADLDESAFQKDYLKLVAEIRKIDTETIKIKAEGVDTSAFEASLSGIKNKVSDLGALSKVAGASKESISTLTAGVSELGSSLTLLSSIAAKGANLDQLDSEAKQVGSTFTKVIGQAKDLKTAVANIGGGVIAFNTSGIDDAIQQINKAKNIPPINVPVTFSIGSLNEMTFKLDDLKKQYAELSAIDRGSDIGKGILNNINQLQGELDSINRGFQSIAQNATGSLDAKVAALNKLKSEYSALSETDRNSDIGKSLAKNIKGLDKEIAKVNSQISETNSLANKAATALGAYFSLQAVKGFVSDMVRVRGEFQQTQTAFKVMLQSKGKADALMAELVQLAATTPFELKDVASGAKQLMAYGFAAKDVTKTLTTLGNVAAGVGAPINDIVYLFGTMRATGRATQIDLQQFAGRGIPIYESLAKVMKVSAGEIRNLVSEGKIGFPEVEKAFQSMTEKGGLFFNLMQEQSQSLTGQISNLSDSWNQMLNEMGKSSEGILSGGIQTAKVLVDNYQEVLDVIGALVAAYGAYKAALVVTAAWEKIANTEAVSRALALKGVEVAEKGVTAAQALQAGATATLRGAWQALTTVMKENPAILVASAVAALTYAIIKLTSASKETSVTLNEYNSELQKEKDTLDGMFDAVQKTAEGTTERKTAIEAINKAYGAYLPNLLTEKSNNLQLADAYSILNQKIQENIALKFKNKNVESLSNKYQPSIDGAFNQIVGSIKDPKKAAQAAKDLNSTVDEINKAYDKLGELKDKNASFTEQKSVADQILKLKSSFTSKYKLMPSVYSTIIDDFAGSKRALKDGLNQIDSFWNAFINEGKNVAGVAKKTLEDYLKEKNFASVFNEAFPLAATKDQLKKVLDRLTDEKESLNRNDGNFEKQVKYYQGLIDKVQAKIDAYDPNKLAKKNAQAAKSQETIENRINGLLEKRRSLLDQINGLHRDAVRSGLGKEQSELDKINEKYELIIQDAQRYNDLYKKINEKYPGGITAFNNKQISEGKLDNVVKMFTQEDFNKIYKDRDTEAFNLWQKERLEKYKNTLEQQKNIFEQYEETKKTIGIEKAKEMYAGQIKGFDDYAAFLQAEAAKAVAPVFLGIATEGDKQKLSVLLKEYKDYSEKQVEEERKRYADLIILSASYNDKVKALEESRRKDISTLEQKYTGDDLADRLKSVNTYYDEQGKQLREQLISLSPFYKALNENLLEFSTSDLKRKLKQLKDMLKKGLMEIDKGNGEIEIIKLTPQMIEDLQSRIDDVNQRLAKTGQLLGLSVHELSELAKGAQDAANILAQMADAVAPLNANLSNNISGMAQVANIAQNALSGMAAYASGDYVGAAQSAVAAVGNIVKMFTDAKKSAKEAKEQVKAFYLAIQQGELDTAAAYRQRALEQAKANKQTLEGLKAEKKALDDNKKAVQDQYNAVLEAIQKEQYISQEATKKKKNSLLNFIGAAGVIASALGAGATTSVTSTLESLAGANYDKLEQLYNSGQLTEKAKALFEQLQKLKEEGADIDAQLEELKQKAQEVYTGTTADNITDMIVTGFENGKRAVADFASDTEDLIRGALLNALKYNIIEQQVQALYEQFAVDAEDNGGLDMTEIQNFTDSINKTVEDAAKFAEQVEKATGISLTNATSAASGTNSLSGAIKGITEDQANIIAGAMNATRMTALEHLNVARQKLDQLKKIEANTAGALVRLASMDDRWNRIEIQGLKVK